MIVRNEGGLLRRCLESVGNHVDAIRIIDTGSDDDTPGIAARFTDDVRVFPWRDDFSAARNASIAEVPEDWILILDADDHFPPGEAEKMRDAIPLATQPALALQYEIMPGHTPEPGLKLFRNGLGIQFEGLIHESIRNSLARIPDARVEHIDVRLLHSGYDHAALPGKVARNLPLLRREFARAEAVGDRMQQLSVGVDLANCQIAEGEATEGEQRLRSLIDDLVDHGLPGDGRWELSALVYLLWHLFGQARHEEALAVCDKCAPLFHAHSVFPLYRGMARMRTGAFALALEDFRRFETSLQDGPPPLSVPAGLVGPELWNMTGQCCLSLGENKAALGSFQRAHDAEPDNQEYAVKLQLARLRAGSA